MSSFYAGKSENPCDREACGEIARGIDNPRFFSCIAAPISDTGSIEYAVIAQRRPPHSTTADRHAKYDASDRAGDEPRVTARGKEARRSENSRGRPGSLFSKEVIQ